MPKEKRAKPRLPERAEYAPNMETYFLTKRSGLFQPGQPFILAFAVPSKKPVKTKGKLK